MSIWCIIKEMTWSPRQAVEIFHLLFLRAFGARVDKSLFALKGGCNLRFFFRSIRYSEDMDMDVHTMSTGTLQSNVSRVLEAQSFVHALRAQDIQIVNVSRPKQTSTTQRWKLMLRATDSGAEFPTKIEFSRRGLDSETALTPVDAEIVRTYRLYPVIVQHYVASSALAQKVLALALRGQVQSRDVFDLKLLLDAGGGEQRLPATVEHHLATAIDNALAVDYDTFAGQVVAFLVPEYQQHFGSRAAWEQLQQQVVEGLEGLRNR
jgi:predicted nucleotidyltransferase component of viral defense system